MSEVPETCPEAPGRAPAVLHFREAMSRIAAAVHVITSDGPAGRVGFTASAVCSVSDTPPTLLVCMNRASRQHAALRQNGVLCVNTLCPASRGLGELFAGQRGIGHAERFDHADWAAGVTGAPLLEAAAMNLEGRITATQEVGSHEVFFVELEAIRLGGPRDALLYFSRRYHTLEGAPAA
ncbi:flavin reductase [Oceanicella sp. SM1341]|uniref:flavin reductase n=1 Tax=Oceanicella sp. SM1341 TaxID=1548889 RepID=UPI000E48861C|nr:flavin reductase [Oceanicella sp. SM1341]